MLVVDATDADYCENDMLLRLCGFIQYSIGSINTLKVTRKYEN